MLEYGCTTAPDKALVNFAVEPTPDRPLPRQHAEDSCFPWAGILIDQRTLAARIDFGYLGRFAVSDALRVQHGQRSGTKLLHAMLQCVVFLAAPD